MRLFKKILYWLTAIILILAVFIYMHMHRHVTVTTEEVIPAGEQADIEQAADKAVGIVEGLKTTYAARGVHAKGHACVKAYFTVNKDIDSSLQHGIFSQPGKQHKAWIRFSNSGSNMAKSDDNAKDARGMAVKLLNVGTNLNGGNTQEFLTHSSPAFFVSSVKDYNEFVATKGDPKYFIQGYNPFKWRIKDLWQLITAYAPPPASPLWTEYFSNTAYKLGPHNIKFMMRACGETGVTKADANQNHDFLRKKLANELANDNACMAFFVQRQDAGKSMPIEDPSVLWKTSDAPFVPVATIQILKQTFDTPEQQQFCEDLSFSPWNALAAHRPIGALNRARRLVYQASANYRHQVNGTQTPTNLNW